MDSQLSQATLLALQLVPLVLSVVCHEYAHGWVAFRLGDPTAKLSGRLTLNPLKHLHWFGSLVLPATLAFLKLPILGFAKPVPIDPRYFTRPYRDLMLVAIAGPIANLSIAAVALVAWHGLGSANPAIYRLDHLPEAALFRDGSLLLALSLVFTIVINILLALFNLIPIPPLDGSRLVTYLLPARGRTVMLKLEPFGFLFILGLVVANAFFNVSWLGAWLVPVFEWTESVLLGLH